MPVDHLKRRRRSVRLKGYDYSQPWAYFVTVCTYRWALLFGAVVDSIIALNSIGKVVEEEWLRTAEIRPYVKLDE